MNYNKYILTLKSGLKVENFALDEQTAIIYIEAWYGQKVIKIELVKSIY